VCPHFCGNSSVPIQTRFKTGTRYSFAERGHNWSHRQLPRIPVHGAAALSNREVLEERNRLRALAFCAVGVSISVDKEITAKCPN
jgi:hypothetical protein